MAILITGSAGYIGSHTVLYLQEQGDEVIVFDDFKKGVLLLNSDIKRRWSSY